MIRLYVQSMYRLHALYREFQGRQVKQISKKVVLSGKGINVAIAVKRLGYDLFHRLYV